MKSTLRTLVVIASILAASSAMAEKVQKATVTIDGGYSPSTVSVKAGQPVEITFFRKEKAGCGNIVVVPDYKFKKEVKTGQSVTFKFTPAKAGTIKFSCGMGMLKGQIVVK